MDPPRLLITADDYGYSRRVNDGILVAARAGAIDAVSAMVGREDCEPEPLLSSGVRIGLHLEPAAEDEAPEGAVERQTESFERLFGRPPGHLDGHHHCHASAPLAGAVEQLATGSGCRCARSPPSIAGACASAASTALSGSSGG
jgi:predicted glycoside hydrolase/deacetylase ChbG (UPF0249 family)